MTRVALTVDKILTAARLASVPEKTCRDILELYRDAYAEGYQDGQLDAEEAHEDVWVEKDPS